MEATATETSGVTAESVLAAARSRHQVVVKAEIDLLQLAAEWVTLHPGDEVDTTIEFGMRDLQIAGDGAPTIDEGAVAEFALAVGRSTDSGRTLLGDAVELRHRLPRLWARVVAGEVAVWKARKVAQATRCLPVEAAAVVDQRLAWCAHRCSFAEIERQVAKAQAEFDPQAAEERRVTALERRHFTIDVDHVTDGIVHIDGDVDLADALALEAAVRAKAATLDPELPLDVRRAKAVGLLGNGEGEGTSHEVVVYTHVRPGESMVDVENGRTVITPDHLKDWCQQAGTKVTIRPVIDLNAELTTDSYRPTPVMKEQTRLRYRECAFVGCHRPAREDDADHIKEWPAGPTASSNLAPCCRTHHRLKTHTAWDYQAIPGVGFLWTSPLGHRYLSPFVTDPPGRDTC